eukprot:TRINITY_DN3385_c0_g2_i1.p1 TRINITY_DN3385_c0_g2~~TRINITY_DN3385_c0_g2_i1.p1  ORF type:complete len:539 (-),score=141.59 TRINITY_DN3385_c0_g2_i1:24-1616(-)
MELGETPPGSPAPPAGSPSPSPSPSPQQKQRRRLLGEAVKRAAAVYEQRPREALMSLGAALAELEHAQSTTRVDVGNAWYYKGLALYQLKQYHECLHALDMAFQYCPKHKGAMARKGATFLDLGRNEEAVTALLKTCEWLSPNASPKFASGVHFNTSLALKLVGRQDDALEHLETALKICPVKPNAFVNKCEMLVKLGRFEQALGSTDEADAMLKDNTQLTADLLKGYRQRLFCCRCNAMILLGRSKAVIELCDQITGGAQSPLKGWAHYEKACALERERLYDEAINSLEFVLRPFPHNQLCGRKKVELVRASCGRERHLLHLNSVVFSAAPKDETSGGLLKSRKLACVVKLVSGTGKEEEGTQWQSDSCTVLEWHCEQDFRFKTCRQFFPSDYLDLRVLRKHKLHKDALVLQTSVRLLDLAGATTCGSQPYTCWVLPATGGALTLRFRFTPCSLSAAHHCTFPQRRFAQLAACAFLAGRHARLGARSWVAALPTEAVRAICDSALAHVLQPDIPQKPSTTVVKVHALAL